jgi:hypothetical protein
VGAGTVVVVVVVVVVAEVVVVGVVGVVDGGAGSPVVFSVADAVARVPGALPLHDAVAKPIMTTSAIPQ